MTRTNFKAALPLAAVAALSACASTAPRQELSFMAADGSGCTAAYEAEMDRQSNQALGTFLGGGLIGIAVTAGDRSEAKQEAINELRACYDRTRTPADSRLAIAATGQPTTTVTTAAGAPRTYSNPDRRGPGGGSGFSTF
jgi:hypothetical protein